MALDELGRRVDEYGPTPFLVTTGAAGAHVVSVAVAFDGRRFQLHAGRTSRANVEGRPSVTLLWPSPSGGPYGLIVDGTARVEGDDIVVDPVRAVLHRLADAPADLPSCVRIEQAD